MQSPSPTTNRWLIAAAGVWVQLFLGTVYAWSYFQQPLVDQYQEFGWTQEKVAGAFSLAICFLGLAAAWGGAKLPQYGPRKLALLGGVLFGLGYILAAVALRYHSLLLLYFGYGVVGGTGLGLGYVTPVATVAKWFPDRKGLATGLVIMGFGFGALLLSKVIAPALCKWADGDFATVFAWLGVCFMAAVVLGAAFLRNPPPGYAPPTRKTLPAEQTVSPVPKEEKAALESGAEKILSFRFAAIWLIFFCNITAGISIISFQSPLFQDLWRGVNSQLSDKTLASYGATLIAVSALFNGLGRMLWGAMSDRIGRLPAFRCMLGSQLAAFMLLVVTGDPWLFGALVCYVLLCYGGGFGTMPSFILDVFGAKRMPQAYGVILTAWSAAGIVGPQIVAGLKNRYHENAGGYAFFVCAGFLAVGLMLSLVMRKR